MFITYHNNDEESKTWRKKPKWVQVTKEKRDVVIYYRNRKVEELQFDNAVDWANSVQLKANEKIKERKAELDSSDDLNCGVYNFEQLNIISQNTGTKCGMFVRVRFFCVNKIQFTQTDENIVLIVERAKEFIEELKKNGEIENYDFMHI